MFRSEARDLMSDKVMAQWLDEIEPPKTWEWLMEHAKQQGCNTDSDVYNYIIESSMRTDPEVNALFGIYD